MPNPLQREFNEESLKKGVTLVAISRQSWYMYVLSFPGTLTTRPNVVMNWTLSMPKSRPTLSFLSFSGYGLKNAAAANAMFNSSRGFPDLWLRTVASFVSSYHLVQSGSRMTSQAPVKQQSVVCLKIPPCAIPGIICLRNYRNGVRLVKCRRVHTGGRFEGGKPPIICRHTWKMKCAMQKNKNPPGL